MKDRPELEAETIPPIYFRHIEQFFNQHVESVNLLGTFCIKLNEKTAYSDVLQCLRIRMRPSEPQEMTGTIDCIQLQCAVNPELCDERDGVGDIDLRTCCLVLHELAEGGGDVTDSICARGVGDAGGKVVYSVGASGWLSNVQLCTMNGF